MWYTLDDNRVSHVSEREVLNQQAYMLFYVRDRKSIIPRKPVDIAKKENMKTNVNVKRDSSTSNHVLKEYPNGSAENKFCGEPSLIGDSSKSLMKDSLVPQKTNVILAENLMQSKKPVPELSSKAQTQEGSPHGISVDKSEFESSASFDHSSKDHSLPNNLKCLAAPVGGKTTMCNGTEISKEVIKDSLSIVPTLSNPQISTDKHTADGTSQSEEKNVVAIVDVAAARDSSTNMSNSTSPITSIIQPDVNCQVGTSATGSVYEKACNIECENVVGSQGLVLNESVNRSLNMESLNQRHVKKSKKKFLKYQVSSMYLRSTFLFMAYLGPRKKNHKRSKRRMLGLKNPNKEKLDKHTISSDVWSSTPGKADVFPCVSSCFESKTMKAGYRHGANVKSNVESLVENNAEGEFRKRIGHNHSVLATATQVENESGCGAVVNQFEARQTYSVPDGKRDQMHNSLMSVLTRGLEETVVARWDEIELPSSQSLESENDKIANIGYVGDEWDEEYDKGKRKKIRGFKHSFGGPNLFQEIASEKSKLKRAKLDQSSSGNLPFRI